MSTTSHIWATWSELYFLPMCILDTVDWWATTLYTSAVLMSMELLLKPRLCKKSALLKRFVISITRSISRSTKTSISILTSLEEPPLRSIKKSSKRYFWTAIKMGSLSNRVLINCSAMGVTDFWPIDLSKELVHTASLRKPLGINVTIARRHLKPQSWSIRPASYAPKDWSWRPPSTSI